MAMTMDAIKKAMSPLEGWASQCHAASVHLINSDALKGITCRVARGSCEGVGGQHSWVVIGDNCYDDDAIIIDPTLWSYDDDVEGIWMGSYRDGKHRPHGKGSIWGWGRPDSPTGEIITLTPRKPLSGSAETFLDLLGPLDRRGWAVLAHAPVEHWPSGEIIDAMKNTKALSELVPIDIVGMITDLNPNGLYLPKALEEVA